MSELQDRCVLLKNLPHTCEERAVRNTLDFAHGDFRYQDKYEKIHRHVEFGDDVRWIVLFKSKKDAIDCISNGPWVSNAIRGGCMVNPDYCSGCIIPDEWFEDTSDDDEDWDMGDSFRTQDSNTETSEDFMNSFVNVKDKKTLIHDDDTDSDKENYAQEIAMVPPFGGTKKPVPAKRSKIIHKSDVSEDALNATVTFDNQFESLIDEIDSADILESRNSKEGMDIVKSELVSENTSRNTSPFGSNDLSEERIPTNELFGSGDVNLKGKVLEDNAAKKTKTDLDKTVSISDRQNSNVEMDTVKCEADFQNMAEDHISSSELFGSGYGKSKEKKMEEVSINRATENDNITVKKRLSNTEMDTGRYTCISERKSDDSYKDMYTETDKSSVLSDNQKKTLTHHSKYVGGDYSDDGKISSVSSTELFESQDEEQDARMSSVDKSDKSKFKYAKRHEKKEEEIVYNGKFNHHTTSETKADGDNNKLYNKSMSTSVRSADLFGNGQESMEFQYRKEQDNFEEANSEQVVGNKRGDSGTEEEKTEDSKRQSVNILPAASDNGHEAINSYQGSQFPHQGMPHVPLGWPYPFYGPMIPNSHNATYGSNMMGQSQPQPNITSPGNPSSAWNMNPMYQMPYHWPMPLQLNDKGQPVYHIPFPGVIPPMHLDEKGNPLQNPGLMNPFYLMPYVPPGHNLYQTPSHQRSTDEKSHPTSEGYLSPRTFNTEHNEMEKSNSRIKEESKPLKYDRSNSLNDAKEYIYDVPYSTHRSLTRQTSAGEITCDQDIKRPYSLTRESKTNFVLDKESNDNERGYKPFPKDLNLEENIYDEIDEDKLKSLRSAYGQPPSLPPTRPPSKPSTTKDKVQTKKSCLPIYDDRENEDDLEEKDSIQSGGVEECCRTILVTGLSPEVSKDALELYFENNRKTGGGEIISAVMNEKKMEAVIEYKETEAAASVIQRALKGQSFTIAGCELTVTEYHPPPMDPFKIFVTGIADTTSKECISNFLAAQTGFEPLSVVFGKTPGTALISFETEIDKTKLRKGCEKRRLEGNYLNISDVEVVRSVKVEGFSSQTITDDSLCLYFENKKKSNGGNVESVKQREGHGDFIVTFENKADAESVCKSSHTLCGQKLKVSLFYPCLELDEDFIVRIPEAIQFEGIDEYIVKFLKNSKKYKEILESSLHENHANVQWHTGEHTFMQIECTVDPNDKKGHLKVKNWTETCTKITMEIIEKLATERSRNVALEVWNEMKVRLQQIEISDPESIAVFLENSDCIIVLSGEKEVVRQLTAKIEDIIDEIDSDLESKRQIITKKKKLKHYEMALIRASRIETSLKKMLSEFVIDNEQREIVCQGMQKNVDEALAKIDQKLNSFVKKSVPGMSKQAIDLLFKKEARDLVKKKMIEKKVIGVWDTVRGSGLVMYSKNDRDLDIAIEILESSVKMDSIDLDSEKRDILDSKDGKAKIAELEENNNGFIIFTLLPNELRFVCVEELYKEVKDEFAKLFDLHSMVSKFVPTELGILEYIRRYKKREIEAIESQYKRLAVEIELKESIRKPGFIVKGKKDGCKLALAKLQSLTDQVVHKDHTVSWPGFDKFIKSSEGKDCIHVIETNEKCVIKVSSDDLSSAVESTVYRRPRSEEITDKKSIITKEVKIGTLASEKVDVIVNSTNRDLNMTLGAISRTLLKAGGDAIRRECETKYPDGIKPGRLATTTGGSLACAEIFHGLLEKWDGGQGHAENVMETFVKSCLALAHTQKYSSIAFPALGTGVMGFPADVVARIMFDTVDAFEAKYPDTSLRLVRFVVWSEDRVTAQAFQDMVSKSGTKRSKSAIYSFGQSEMAENLIVKNKGYSTTIGSVTVSITKDDLTTSTSEAIVNSTTDDLNLDSGAISRAILQAAGSTIQREALSKTEYFMKNGLVVTGSGKLMCRAIIHVRARNSLNTWADTIWKCLSVAEQKGLNSIAFPALGTGGKGVPPDRMAKTMIETFKNYFNSSDFQRCIKTVKVVIFDEKMLNLFIAETKAIIEPDKTAKQKGLFSGLKFWEKKTPVAEPVQGTTFHIYCESKYMIDRVVEKVDKIRRENDVFVKMHVLEHFDETHKSDLRRIGYTNGVKVVLGKSRVTILGYGRAVDMATKKVEEYIYDVDKDIRKGYASSAVKLPKNWTKMKLTDPLTTVVLLPGDEDMVFVSRKFQMETGFPPNRIVKIERVQNPTLYIQYIGKKTQMERDNQGRRQVEQLLWHGTNASVVNLIKYFGFDRNYNSGASHGAGVYFAVKASTSASGYCQPDAYGHKHIFLAHVLTGEYCVGQSGIRVPPQNPGSKSGTFDSTTDNMQAPNFFVIFHDAQAYPSYLITFK